MDSEERYEMFIQEHHQYREIDNSAPLQGQNMLKPSFFVRGPQLKPWFWRKDVCRLMVNCGEKSSSVYTTFGHTHNHLVK
jgi:hypothetical protein